MPPWRSRTRSAMWAASVSALKASPRITSSIASFTTSSKRDMCAPFCSGAEIHEALELGVEELLVSVRADADDLLDAGHADAREAHLGGWAAGLDVAPEERCSLVMAMRQLYSGTGRSIAPQNAQTRCRLAAAARPGHWPMSSAPRGQRRAAAQPDIRDRPCEGQSGAVRRSEGLTEKDEGVAARWRSRPRRVSSRSRSCARSWPRARARLPDLRGDRGVPRGGRGHQGAGRATSTRTWSRTAWRSWPRTARPPGMPTMPSDGDGAQPARRWRRSPRST